MHTNHAGSIISVPLSSENLTVEEAIIDALEKFNRFEATNLVFDPNLYSVYPARKSGKRNPDFPAFDREQQLKSTCFKKFYLQ